MQVAVVSLFPEMFQSLTGYGITGRAVDAGILTLSVSNPRDFATDRHGTVDDRPYGGGPGMLMKMDTLVAAVSEARSGLDRLAGKTIGGSLDGTVSGSIVSGSAASGPIVSGSVESTAGSEGSRRTVYLTPQGRPLTQQKVLELAALEQLVLIAGRYEGIDERFVEAEVDEEISIGDYVLSGGELPAMVLLDAICRQLPGALGHEQSAAQDSFAQGLLDCPHYTRPEQYAGKVVPRVLLSGNHGEIERWRLKQALSRTLERRPDLLEGRSLSKDETALLQEIRDESADRKS